jgi:hypothetical protein
MSWMMNPTGEPPRSPRPTDENVDQFPKVPDPSNPDRMVSTRQSNRPYLAYVRAALVLLSAPVLIVVFRYKEYRDKREAEHQAWVERMKEREEKIKKGEEVGPPEVCSSFGFSRWTVS